jgi:glucose-6-phosphate 1-dehydrogenase
MRIVVAGGAGDLARRMLLPSLYFLDAAGQLSADLEVVGVSRHAMEADAYLDFARAAIMERSEGCFDPAVWERFARRLHYLAADLTSEAGGQLLRERVGQGETIFFLAVSPDLFGAICNRLSQAGLSGSPNRVVLEKPIGRDRASSAAINTAVDSAFSEDRTYRIDHYLGKETVQNLLALRFANVLFEPVWNNHIIDHVQITVAEIEGVGARWPYYDDYGALRDMLQNHMLQLLCLIAMEPPTNLKPDCVRNEKVKILQSLRPIRPEDAARLTVRGQYRAGVSQGRPAAGYLEERGAPSDTETFVAVCAQIDNWRWAGVPFFLRTGKRLPEKRTQIVIQFRPVPHSIFAPAANGDLVTNRLVIDLQPNEGISLLLMNKAPDFNGFRLAPLSLNLSLDPAAQGMRRRIAYERLLLDVIENNSTLFVRRDEVEASWTWIDGVRHAWAESHMTCKPYDAGSWGPPSAHALIERFGRSWND